MPLPPPHLVLLNADIRTQHPNQPRAEALAMAGNRIVAVGRNTDIEPLAGPGTRVLHAGGRLVLPGFNDAHVHFLLGGFSLTEVDLRDAASPEEFIQRIATFARQLPQGRWILGGLWDHEKWPGSPLPTRAWIDAVTPGHPVFINRLDGHMALANSAALRLAGITAQTSDPPGGLIVRDPATGEPTGLLKDCALDLVARVRPAPTFDDKLNAARAASNHAAALGVTSVQDMSAGADLAVFQHLHTLGELKTRIYGLHPIPRWDVLPKAGIRAPFGPDMLRLGAVKGFADGSLGSTTAFFFEPYADAPDTCGLLFDQMLPEGIMLERALGADQAGLQVTIHAIGDRANQIILDLYEEVVRQHGARDRRCRIEHAQHLRPQDIPRFARLGVIASVQPSHASDDGRWCDKRLGPERARSAYAFRSLLDAGARLAFGTDWTVAPLNPMLTLHAAVTRRTLDGSHPDGWIPGQKITLEEAVRAYTVGSAYAEFADHHKGTLAPGMLADCVLLDRNIMTGPPEEIDQARALLTIVDGRVVHETGGIS